MKQIRYFIEAVLLYAFFGFFKILPPATASNIGGWIGRTVGPRLAASHKALNNLASALPEKTEAEKKKIVADMWDNLGRVMAEYPHLEKIGKSRITVVNRHIVENAIKSAQGGVFFGAHQGNWEVNIPAMLMQYNIAAYLTYRAANNPMSDYLLEKARTLGGRITVIPKARSSAKDLMNALKDKHFLGILIDQKYNEGLGVDFFDRPAMTNPIAVALGQKYKCPLIPVQNRRTGPAQFEITLHEPLPLFTADGRPLPVEQVLQAATMMIESWIRQEPGQWLWLHRRWDSNFN